VTQNEDTAVDRWHRAVERPEDAGPADVRVALEGRYLSDPDLLLQIEPWCKRCEQNNMESMVGSGQGADGRLRDGDRVTFHALFDQGDDDIPAHWRIRRLYHITHPQPAWADAMLAGEHQARCRGRLDTSDSDELRLVDVEVVEHSPASEGPKENAVQTGRERPQ